MAKIIQCVPNISEGRRPEIVEAVVNEVRTTMGVTLVDYSSDASHNRTVITFLGNEESVGEAAFKLAKKAIELIDLRVHEGEHPRMGAVDVIPFIPIRETSLDECDEIAKNLGQRLWDECKMPVFLYEHSATTPKRENLATVRKGQFEGMKEKMAKPEWTADFGGNEPHESAGVVAVGARMPLVAFNINLDTPDLTIANNISKIIRRSSGGFDCVKALGVMLEDRNIAQVSINMTNFNKTPLYRVLETVRFEAKRYGVNVVGTEIIGLTPVKALVDCAEYYLQIENFDSDKQVLENNL